MARSRKRPRLEDLPQLGKRPRMYRFFLNPYSDERFTKCPQCSNKMHQRKLPLVIHIAPMGLLSLNKTCRYCPHCDLLIAHQNDLERLLTAIIAEHKPLRVGDDYLVVGTMERAAWKRGTQQPPTIQDMLDKLHDFKDVITFTPVYGWGK